MPGSFASVTVSGRFDDHAAAEIACALLADASLDPDLPVDAQGEWLVRVPDLKQNVAGRAEVILRRAQARSLQSSDHVDRMGSLGAAIRGLGG